MQSLLPASSGLFEVSLERSFYPAWNTLNQTIPVINTAKLVSPPASYLPYLIYEYGLGVLTPYVPNLYDLIDDGIKWQRVRGTFEAVQRGLAWIDYEADVEEAWHGRSWWNSYQLRFTELPAQDNPDLERIEAITTLSVPARSRLRRGVYQYDVQPIEADGTRLECAHIEHESGTRATPAGTIWSFGRVTESVHTLTQFEGELLGIWIDPPEEENLLWVNMNYPWITANILWADNAVTQRQALMAAFFNGRPTFACLRSVDGDVIGYRRCRAVSSVRQQYAGAYNVAGTAYQPILSGTSTYIEAMTDFDDCDDVVLGSVSLIINASVAGVPSGRLWLQPQQLSGGVEIFETPLSLPLRRTVRDQFKFLVRF